MIDKRKKKYNKVILIGILQSNKEKAQFQENINELKLLVETFHAKIYKVFFQKLPQPDAKTFLKSGKIESIHQYITDNKIDTIVFDEELSSVQIKNIEFIFKNTIIIDRTQLILDIFFKRAQTFYSRTQVELAQYQYLLPRLKNMWTHLERQRGGIGLRSGSGEAEIETDRRLVRERIALLKKKLSKIDQQMLTQRKNRANLVQVSLVGYTNSGKSTLMNLLSKSTLIAENKLFATLDTTVRKIFIKDVSFLISDTVGFIRKIPIQLIKSFKSTLDVVREAHIILHIVDISNNNFQNQIQVVEETLSEIGIQNHNKKIILIFNKIDKKEQQNITHNLQTQYSSIIFISAKTKENINNLKLKLYNIVHQLYKKEFKHFLIKN